MLSGLSFGSNAARNPPADRYGVLGSLEGARFDGWLHEHLGEFLASPELPAQRWPDWLASDHPLLGPLLQCRALPTFAAAWNHGQGMFRPLNSSVLQCDEEGLLVERRYETPVSPLRECLFVACLLALVERVTGHRCSAVSADPDLVPSGVATSTALSASLVASAWRVQVHAECLPVMLASSWYGFAASSFDPQPRVAREVLRLLAARQRDGVLPDLEEAAAELGLSRRSLQRRLGEHGLAYRDMITQMRCLLTAAALVRQGNASLTSIAMQCGFVDVSHMRRAFVRHVGLTPAEFRRYGCDALRHV